MKQLPETHCTTLKRRDRIGFTLVELMVAIAVLAVLASLLLGVVNKVRENSRASTCVANLRNLGAALSAYNLENNDMFPSFPNLHSGLLKYTTKATFVCPSANLKDDTRENWQSGKLFATPGTWEADKPFTGYGYNGRYLSPTWSGSPERVPPQRKRFKYPSHMIVMADNTRVANSKPSYAYYELEPPTLANAMPHGRHNSRANLLFLDGHVGSSLCNYDPKWGYLTVRNFDGMDDR